MRVWVHVLLLWLALSILYSAECLTIQVVEYGDTKYDFSDSNAIFQERSSFLPDHRNDAIIGPLMYPNPRNACGEVTSPPNQTFIAFLEEYLTCPDFSTANIKNAGFMAMISYTQDKSAFLKTKSMLPRVLIMDLKFASYLVENVLPYNSTSDSEIVLWDDSFAKMERLLVIFGAILLVTIVLSICVFCFSLFCRVALVKWRTRGLARWQVRALPKRKFHEKKETMKTCSICLEEFKESESIRVLPCEHVFHPKCVDEWLQKWNRTCPFCKSTIKRRGGRNKPPPAQTDDNETSLLLPQEERASMLSNENQASGTSYGTTKWNDNHDTRGSGNTDQDDSIESGHDGSLSVYHTPHQSEDEDYIPSYATAHESQENSSIRV